MFLGCTDSPDEGSRSREKKPPRTNTRPPRSQGSAPEVTRRSTGPPPPRPSRSRAKRCACLKEAEARISGLRLESAGSWLPGGRAGQVARGAGHGEAAARPERPGRRGAGPDGAGTVPGRGDGGRWGGSRTVWGSPPCAQGCRSLQRMLRPRGPGCLWPTQGFRVSVSPLLSLKLW